VRRADNLTTFTYWLSWNLGASTSWNPLGLPRSVMGMLCFALLILARRPDTTNSFALERIRNVEMTAQIQSPTSTWTQPANTCVSVLLFPGRKSVPAWRWPLTSTECRCYVLHSCPQYAFMIWCLAIRTKSGAYYYYYYYYYYYRHKLHYHQANAPLTPYQYQRRCLLFQQVHNVTLRHITLGWVTLW